MAYKDKDKEKARDSRYRTKHRDQRNAYSRQYYADHRDHIKARSRQYYDDNKDHLKVHTREYMQQYYAEHREHLRALKRVWVKTYYNPKKKRANYLRYRATHEEEIRERYRKWLAVNPEKAKEAQTRWRESHRDQLRERDKTRQRDPLQMNQIKQRHKARKRNATLGPVNLKAIYERDKGICGICHRKVDKKDLSFDHIIPLSCGGPHTEDNLQVAHILCNSRRGAGYLPAQIRLAI